MLISVPPLSLAARRLDECFLQHDEIDKKRPVSHWLTLAIVGVGMTLSAIYIMPSLSLRLISVALGWTLILLASIDIRLFRLPDIITLPLVIAGIAISWWLPSTDMKDHIFGALAGYAALAGTAYLYRRWRGKDGLGLGDAKLAAAAGAWLSWESLPSVLLIACAVAFAYVGVRAVAHGKATLSQRIAFGVPLAFGIWYVWLFGPLLL